MLEFNHIVNSQKSLEWKKLFIRIRLMENLSINYSHMRYGVDNTLFHDREQL